MKVRVRRRTFVCATCGATFKWRRHRALRKFILCDAFPHRHMSRTYMDAVVRLTAQAGPARIRA